MSNLQNAVQNLRQFARTMQPLVAVADALDSIVSLDTHGAELAQKVAELKAEVEQLDAANDAAAAKVSAALAQANEITDKAVSDADAIRSAAEAEAEKIKAEALELGKKIVAAAGEQADAQISGLNASLAGKRKDESDLATLVAQRGEELKRLDDEISKREQKLAEVKAALAKLAE